MKRRAFVKSTGSAALISTMFPRLIKSTLTAETRRLEDYSFFNDDNITIIIEMFGGNDGLNTIIPAYDDEYYALRPQIAIPKTIAKQFQNTNIYFNPALVQNIINNGMMNLFETGRLSIIQGIGYHPSNLSHFRSQEIWYSGYNTSDPNEKLLDGWLGRFISLKLPDFPNVIPDQPIAIQIGPTLSMLLKSNEGDMGIALTSPDAFYELGKNLIPYEDYRDVSTNYDREFNFNRLVAEMAEKYSREIKTAFDIGKDKVKVDYSDGLPQQFKLISQLIAGGLKTKIYYVKLSNFDSHAQQQNSDFITGQHPTLLSQVAKAICEFMDDAMKQGWADRVNGFTMSEFGRRAYDNGSRGTDHGAGSMQFVFGNHVNGGYYGELPDLTRLDEDGNLPMQFDYRRTFADFLVNWFSATEDDVQQVFKQSFLPIGVLKPRITGIESHLDDFKIIPIDIYPMPSHGYLTVSINLKEPAQIKIRIYNQIGKLEKEMFSGFLDNGNHLFPLSIHSSGNYICSINVEGRIYNKKFVVQR